MTHAVWATASGPGMPAALPPLPPAPAMPCHRMRKLTSSTRLYTIVLSRSSRPGVTASRPLDREAAQVLGRLRGIEALLLAEQERVRDGIPLRGLVPE